MIFYLPVSSIGDILISTINAKQSFKIISRCPRTLKGVRDCLPPMIDDFFNGVVKFNI